MSKAAYIAHAPVLPEREDFAASSLSRQGQSLRSGKRSRLRRDGFLFTLALLLTPACTLADSSADAVTPDRPGFTNGSDVVPVGRVQVEGGVTRSADSAGSGHVTDAPEILIRAGLSGTTELRLNLPNYEWPSGKAGFSDGAVGLRYKFYQSKDGNTKFAFTPSLSVPIKSAVTTSGHADPTFLLSGQTTSGSRWGISSNLILSYPTQSGIRLANYTATAQVTYSLSGPLSVFGDIYDNGVAGSLPSPTADGGFTYKVANNAQLDIETGRGLGGTAPVQFYGGGLAVRF